MELNWNERVQLLHVLPPQGNVGMMRIVHDLRMTLEATEEENDEYKIKTVETATGVTTKWNAVKGSISKEIPISEKAKDILSDGLKQYEADGKITEQMLGVYDRFVEKKGE